jgi:GH18 family chitinase
LISSRHSFIGGIDLDFFQPRTIEERDNYLSFLTEATTQWHHQGLKVSLTLHPHQGRMIPPSVYKLLDRIHFMTYDMIQSNTDPGSSNYHASLSKVRQAVEELLQDGGGLETAPHKVLLGIPAYARHIRNPSQVKTFSEIYDGIRKESEKNPNPSKKTEKIELGDTDSTLHSWKGYEWESPTRIRAKIDLAKELNLGGVFFWELGQDKTTNEYPGGILLETAAVASYDGSPLFLETSRNQGTTEL